MGGHEAADQPLVPLELLLRPATSERSESNRLELRTHFLSAEKAGEQTRHGKTHDGSAS